MLFLAMPEETSFCFQIHITTLSDISEQLDKQIQFYCIEEEYAGTKQQLSIYAVPALQDELWEQGLL